MTTTQPWATCLLTGMLIRFLEQQYPGACGRVDYQRILSAAEGIQDIRDPRAFLLDLNNWVPHHVLGELIRRCEDFTGEKDFTYLAARAYYNPAQERPPSLLETIAILLDDIKTVLGSADDWASGFTNYLQLQGFVYPWEPQSLYVVSRFKPPVDPFFGNVRLVQGNIEGISTLDPLMESISCEEQYSQVRLISLVAEFGKAYIVSSKPGRIIVTRRSTGEVVLVAKPISLTPEWVPYMGLSQKASPASEDQGIILPDNDRGISVLAPYQDTAANGSCDAQTAESVPALRIEQGGTLSIGRLSLTIKKGAVYDAPYTRYRIQWHKREPPPQHAVSNTKGSLAGEKQSLALLLFNHLTNHQATQRRTLSTVIQNVELVQENTQLRDDLTAQLELGGIIGKSRVIQELLSLVRTVAASDTTVLLTGETGTGKELAARLIHQLSRRRGQRFMGVNCRALPESLLESELFGHEQGAFTGAVSQKKGKFELTEGGTLFLDEIGDITPAVQAKLLRVLQEKEFQRVGGSVNLKADVRIITATNRDLDALAEQNKFRRDLYYRLNVILLCLPPLRERTEDIPELAHHFVRRFAERAGKPIEGLSPEALQLCLSYQWPGNIRELENVVERAVTLASDRLKWIGPDLLPLNLRTSETTPSPDLTDMVYQVEWSSLLGLLRKHGSLTGLLSQLEWAITHRAILENGGNKSRAARTLGRSYRWLRKLETAMTENAVPHSSLSDQPKE